MTDIVKNPPKSDNNTPEDYRGAESKLFLQEWFGQAAVYKVRLPKTYRIPELDLHFRKQRMVFESRLLTRAKAAGVRTPIIYEIDLLNTTIVMEYIEGEILRTALPKLSPAKRTALCAEVGRKVGLLHSNGLIHGDLTTSNMLLSEDGQVVFIDFGLGYISDRLEDAGIDVYLLERALHSTHGTIFESCWQKFIEGYKETSCFSTEIEKKVEEIASRGRYSDRV